MVTEAIMEPMSPAKKQVEANTYSKRIAVRLRELREQRGWLVEKLTFEINANLQDGLKPVAQSTVHGWDNGTRKVDHNYLPVIARAMKITIAHLLPKS